MITGDMSLAEMQIEVRSLMAKKGVSRNPLIGVINISRFTSKLYELIVACGTCTFSAEVIRKYVGVYDWEYTNYVEFKKEVIAESVHEINKYMHMKISYRTKRKSDRYLISFNVE